MRSLHRKPPVSVRFCAPQWRDGIINVVHKKFLAMVPRYLLKGGSWDKGWMDKHHTLYFANGSTITFKSAEEALNTYGGDDLDAIYVDEHLPWLYYLENLMRTTDRAGYIVNMMTPEAGISWEEDHITDPPVIPGVGPITIDHWFFDTEKNPHLSKDGVAKVKAMITDEAMADTKLRGQFRSLSGLVLPQWNPAIHVIPDYEIPAHWPRVCCIDTHHRTPSAIMFAAWSPAGEVIVYRCHKAKMTVPEWQKWIRANTIGETISLWLLDEAGGGEGKDINEAESICNQFQRGVNRIPFVRVTKDSEHSFAAGIYKLWEYLSIKVELPARDDRAIHNGSKIQVFRSCDHPNITVDGKISGSLPWEMKRFQYKREQKADEEMLREKIRLVNEHYICDLRYIIMAGVQTSGQNITSALKGMWE